MGAESAFLSLLKTTIDAILAGDTPVPVTLDAAPTITIGEVDQGAKGDAATDAWYTQLVTAAGTALLGRLAAASSLPIVLSTEDKAVIDSIDGKLAAAAAASDATANPTTSSIRSMLMGWDATQWLRLLAGQLGAQDATALARMLNVLAMGRYNSTPLALTNGQGALLQLTSTGQLRVVSSPPATAADGRLKKVFAGSALAAADATLAADNTVFAGVGRVDTVGFLNNTGSTVWVGVYDTTSALSTSIPVEHPTSFGNGSSARATLGDYQIRTGLKVGISTTSNQYVAAGTLTTSILTVTYTQ